jgi:hypothetical protein
MKLQPLTIWISGLCLGVSTLSYAFFQHYKPNKEESQNYVAHKEALEAEAAKMPQAKKRVADATEKLRAADAAWQGIVERKTPTSSLDRGGINLAVNRYQLVANARKFRNSIQQAVNNQVRKGGIKVITGPTIPEFPNDPLTIVETGFNYPGFPFPVLIYNLGAIEVEGTFDQILNNVEAWTTMPNYIAVTDGLRIAGTSPLLRGTYSLTVIGFIRGDQISPPVPAGPAVEGSSGSGGGGPALSGASGPFGGGGGEQAERGR